MKAITLLLEKLGLLTSGCTEGAIKQLIARSVSEALPKQLVGFEPETLAAIIKANYHLSDDQKNAILRILRPKTSRPTYFQ